jgi:hypothetical protein
MRLKLNRYEHSKKLIKVVDGRKMIHSHEFYKSIGLVPKNYCRWIMETALSIGKPNQDYIPAPGNIEKSLKFLPGKNRVRYFFELDFAISLCLVARTKEAILLAEYLKEQRNL